MSKNKVTTLFIIHILLVFCGATYSQDISWNEECNYAYNINDVSDFCSDSLDFSNISARPSNVETPFGWPSGDIINGIEEKMYNDVWISFRPDKTSMLVRLFGKGSFQDKTMINPSLAIYTGTCGNLNLLFASSKNDGINYIEFLGSDVQVGAKYYIRIAAEDLRRGTFRLCINTFPKLKKAEADCINGNLLCDKSPYSLDNLQDIGVEKNEVAASCIEEEFASVWLKWVIKDAGSLTFTVFPNNNTDDLDWVLYLLPSGLQDCSNKKIVRCNAAGETSGRRASFNAPCLGPTGLSTKSTDKQETPGCGNGKDNFVAAVDAKQGEVYALIVNNYSQSGNGFTLRFDGTSTFLGPDIDLDISAINKIECDKSAIIKNKIVSQVDSIVKYNWSFGEGANIQTATTSGPHSLIYDTFGNKVASLSVESQRGCIVTKALNFYVEPCCTDFNAIESEINLLKPVRCYGEKNAEISITANNKIEPTKYFLNNRDFQLNPVFKNLEAGDVSIIVADAKGCMDTSFFVIPEALFIDVDLGPDITIEAGTTLELRPIITPSYLEYVWDTTSLCRLENFDVRSLDQILYPFGDNILILTAKDTNNCLVTDTLHVRANSNDEIYYPNIISANHDNLNDIFSFSNEEELTEIKELSIFDRWGNIVYNSTNMVVNDKTVGWNGTFNQDVIPGVYVWVAKVKFIDCAEKVIRGDVTVVK